VYNERKKLLQGDAALALKGYDVITNIKLCLKIKEESMNG